MVMQRYWGNGHFEGMGLKVATLQSPKGVLGPEELETELKMSSQRLPAPGSKKVKIRAKKEPKKLKKVHLLTLFDSDFNFFETPRGRNAPGTHVQLRFQLWAHEKESKVEKSPLFNSFSTLILTFLLTLGPEGTGNSFFNFLWEE